MPWARMETEKMAREAATRRVSSQEKDPEPRITRTICARSTMNRKITGRDQNTIALPADFKCFKNSSFLPSQKDFAKVGKAATAYDMPMILSGTDCRLKEKLKTELDPLFKKEASATMEIRAMLLKARPRVRGNEEEAVPLIFFKLTGKENFGVKPQPCDANACTPKCIKAPRAT